MIPGFRSENDVLRLDALMFQLTCYRRFALLHQYSLHSFKGFLLSDSAYPAQLHRLLKASAHISVDRLILGVSECAFKGGIVGVGIVWPG